jgi:branched-chain amino acid transport system substrate-binding protein
VPSASTRATDRRRRRCLGPLALAIAACAPLACGQAAPAADPIPVGLLLSFTGNLAASSVNSERALLMAVESANAAGGVGGRPLVLVSRDTRSDPGRVIPAAQQLLDAGAALFIGPDTVALAVQLKSALAEQLLILPSFATSNLNIYKPPTWFVMGATPARVACELMAQLRADGREQPLVIAEPTGHNSLLAFELMRSHGLATTVLPGDPASVGEAAIPVSALPADAYVLATVPAAASGLLYNLATIGAFRDPRQWYLAPTLHSPALLETIPRGMLQGARGVATGTIAGASDFSERFARRWQDAPLDDAYPFYDAGAVAALALQRALAREGAIPTGHGLSPHIVAVTRASGTPVRWDEIGRGLQLLREGQEVGYIGLTGALEFDASGQTAAASTSWWTVGPEGFRDIPSSSNCR